MRLCSSNKSHDGAVVLLSASRLGQALLDLEG